MIKKQTIIDLIESHFEGTDKFIVDIKVLAGNKIEVYIDAPNHIVIADCVALSRFIEENLDREKEDYELQVSSPGATESFKVLPQYKKYIGTKVSVKTTEGVKHEGVLMSANENEFVIEETRREKKAVGKGNHTVTENITLTYKQTKETKSVLPF
jgi:ribosome maturation factor RimP